MKPLFASKLKNFLKEIFQEARSSGPELMGINPKEPLLFMLFFFFFMFLIPSVNDVNDHADGE